MNTGTEAVVADHQGPTTTAAIAFRTVSNRDLLTRNSEPDAKANISAYTNATVGDTGLPAYAKSVPEKKQCSPEHFKQFAYLIKSQEKSKNSPAKDKVSAFDTQVDDS